MDTTPAISETRENFFTRAAQKNLSPLWPILDQIASDAPRSPCIPALWRYKEVRPFLMEAAELISAQEAERRVMVLENPGMDHANRITHSLYAGLQVVLPGEVAPAHRHTANALRFIVEGNGAYTAVAGEKTLLHPGDFVITPGWTWHDHGNHSEEPVIWIDGLDVHLVNLIDAAFRESYSELTFPAGKSESASYTAYGHNMVPIDHKVDGTGNSPIFNYPYRVTREVLHRLSRNGDPDACHGFKMKFIDPTTGSWAMPTISSCMQLLPAGFATSPYRSTDGTIFSVVEGRGKSIIHGQTYDWVEKDIFVVPSWHFVQHFVETDAVLFSYSDRATQEKLGFWREQRGNEAVKK